MQKRCSVGETGNGKARERGKRVAPLDSLHPETCQSGQLCLCGLQPEKHLPKLAESLLSLNITDTMLPVSELEANLNSCRYREEQSEGVF